MEFFHIVVLRDLNTCSTTVNQGSHCKCLDILSLVILRSKTHSVNYLQTSVDPVLLGSWKMDLSMVSAVHKVRPVGLCAVVQLKCITQLVDMFLNASEQQAAI